MATPNQIVQEVLQGRWGNGDTRKEKLAAAGYSWIEIQSLINKQYGLKPVAATDMEIAQEVLENKWGLGVDRRMRITNAGFNYNTIQNLANRLASQKNSNEIKTPSAAAAQETNLVKNGGSLIGITKVGNASCVILIKKFVNILLS